MIDRKLGSGMANNLAKPSALESLAEWQFLVYDSPDTDVPRSRDIIRDFTPCPQD